MSFLCFRLCKALQGGLPLGCRALCVRLLLPLQPPRPPALSCPQLPCSPGMVNAAGVLYVPPPPRVWTGSLRTVEGASLCSPGKRGGRTAYISEPRLQPCYWAPLCSLCPGGAAWVRQPPVHLGLAAHLEETGACLRGLLAGRTDGWKVPAAGPLPGVCPVSASALTLSGHRWSSLLPPHS